MAMYSQFQSSYDPYTDSYRGRPRSREEFEMMKALHMQKEMMRAQNVARPCEQEAQKPPKHLNKKLLLTKGA